MTEHYGETLSVLEELIRKEDLDSAQCIFSFSIWDLKGIPTNANHKRNPMTTRSLQNIMKVWGLKTLRGKSGHPHAFRHTVGQALTDEQGVGTAKIALAHENIQTTEQFYLNKFVNPSKILKDKWKR